MCRVMEEMCEKERKKERKKNQRTSARIMLSDGILSLEKIAQYSNLPLDEVRRIASEQSNSGPAQHMEDMTKWK